MRERGFAVAAWFYLICLPLAIPLRGPLYLHDLAAPVLLAGVVARRDWRAYLRFPDLLLPVFLVLAAMATLVHGPGGWNLYRLAVVGYLALVYVFFAGQPLQRRHLAWYGLAVLGAMWFAAAWQVMRGTMATVGVYEQSTLEFLVQRFSFTFPNPNLAGSFYVLPVACLLLGVAGRGRRLEIREMLFGLLALAVLLVPLGLTVSKHMLLSFAVIAGAVVVERGRSAGWRWLGLAAVLGVFALFYLTVLFPFFPLQTRFPFFNHATWGMYTIHQDIYWRILAGSFSSLLLGVGPTAMRELYPLHVDIEHVQAVLAQYEKVALAESFATYMDAHNEYLSTGTAFGLPALAALLGFWISRAAVAFRRHRDELVLFFVVGLLCCCLWDDLASKRWIWLTLALLAGSARRETEAAA
ncbi:MAG: hypothetical protein RBU25_00675 [Lentisphaeria bacterium]|jgi:hypothetical protein|nr:hypothetical protein [Lentisphaeria bacterium]